MGLCMAHQSPILLAGPLIVVDSSSKSPSSNLTTIILNDVVAPWHKNTLLFPLGRDSFTESNSFTTALQHLLNPQHTTPTLPNKPNHLNPSRCVSLSSPLPSWPPSLLPERTTQAPP